MEFFDLIAQFFKYGFLQKALIVGLLISICAALLGVSLVLKRYSMIGDGLSHVGFGSLAVAMAFNWAPLAVSLPVVIIAAFVLLRLSERGKIKGDAAIALISAGSLAFGVFIVSVTSGLNTDVEAYLFGSILALSQLDVALSIVLTVLVVVVFTIFYNRIFAVTFDETYARAVGLKAGLYNSVLAFLTACTVVLGMRMMGALLISSLLIFPALSSMWICKRFASVTVVAVLVSLVCFVVGIAASFVLETPTGATIVLFNLLVFVLLYLASKFKFIWLKQLKMIFKH